MRQARKLTVSAVAFVLLISSVYVSASQAGELLRALSKLTEPVDAIFHRKNPHAPDDDVIECLAKEMDWVEHHIDTYGTVVAKQPDVWGEARLMCHRGEFERQMAAQLGNFKVKMNAALRRSDQAFLGMAMALQGKLQGATDMPEIPSSANANSSYTFVSGLLSDPTAKDTGATTPEPVITRLPPFGLQAKAPAISPLAAAINCIWNRRLNSTRWPAT